MKGFNRVNDTHLANLGYKDNIALQSMRLEDLQAMMETGGGNEKSQNEGQHPEDRL